MRVLLTTQPDVGHLHPLLPVACGALSTRGTSRAVGRWRWPKLAA
jgi:hypothetical protein